MKRLWWEQINEMKDDYLDLEWLVYNSDLLDARDWTQEDFDQSTGPLSEQLWAIREGLA